MGADAVVQATDPMYDLELSIVTVSTLRTESCSTLKSPTASETAFLKVQPLTVALLFVYMWNPEASLAKKSSKVTSVNVVWLSPDDPMMPPLAALKSL